MYKHQILKKAKKIIKKREFKKEFLETCKKAKICPLCGNDLIRMRTLVEMKKDGYDETITRQNWINSLECPKKYLKKRLKNV